MELFGIIAELWQRRLIVAVGALLAVVLGGALVVKAGGSRSSVGVASQVLMLDTPRSELVNAAPERAENLGWQSSLLGYSLASDTVEREIAGDLGITPSDLVIRVPSIETPAVKTPLPEHAAEAAAARPEPYMITVRLTPKLPLISLNATAPDRERAQRLTDAAAARLRALPASAGNGKPPFVVEVVSPTRTKAIATRPRRIMGIAIGVLAFAFWCAGTLVLPALGRASGAAPRPVQAA